MIRNATIYDVQEIVVMGCKFIGHTRYAKHIYENPKAMTMLAEKLISQNGLLISEVGNKIIGMLGFIVYRHFISDELIAGEVFWWVEEEHRGKDGIKLFLEMKRRAKQIGAKRLQMIAPTEKVAEFYKRIGFEFVESTYQMNL